MTDLPDPEFADNAERLALGDGDVDVLHRAHDAAPGGELDGEILHPEQRPRRGGFGRFGWQ